MHLGAAWYPEHWPETRWPEDVRLMREAGCTVCRIAEFAWSTLESTEGHYAFDWLERAIELLHANGMKVVLGTPTAAPPAWLTHHHPDTLAIEPNGRPAQHGNRCHVNPSSSTFLKYARRVVEQMAKRYGRDTRIMGWQIDNEYNRVDYSDDTRRKFQSFLKERYGTLDALNAPWSTAYWSQTYTDWNEIPLPIGPHNPGLMLAFRHFVTRTWHDFQKMQCDAIRQVAAPEQWITHNFMGWFDAFDHYVICEDLDFASWDWYIGTGHHDYTRTGAAHDLTRGFKRKNFWLMETQPGAVNWAGINTTLNRGEARCMAWHAAAHGADAVLYWQWRPAHGGQEQLHGSLLGADGQPRPFYSEVQQLGRDFAAASAALEGTSPRNEVALLHSYDARWSLNWQRHHKDFDPVRHLELYYQPLAARNVGVDVISATAPLDGYKLVIAPALVVLPDATVAHLTAFVEQGGTLVLTVRCGQKDAHNALFPTLQPGPLRALAGVETEEFYALESPVPLTASWGATTEGESRLWAERLRPLAETTETLAVWGASNGWLDGHPAVTRHPVGTEGGQVITVGAVLDDTLQNALTGWLLERAQVEPVWRDAPAGVEVGRRIGPDGRSVLMFLNHTRQEVTLTLPAGGGERRDLLTGEAFTAEFSLSGYGVRVFSG
ncbi:MAG TPA: beta-galactosidase [Chthonomonadaceae bacterium]|nr:beta-galactosidase [Chthonomonadaceae bacterium]